MHINVAQITESERDRQNTEWKQSRMDIITNGHHPEWTQSRMDTISNEHLQLYSYFGVL